jgi:hypothetical protein
MSRAAAQGLGKVVQLARQQGAQTTSLLPSVGATQQHIRSVTGLRAALSVLLRLVGTPKQAPFLTDAGIMEEACQSSGAGTRPTTQAQPSWALPQITLK